MTPLSSTLHDALQTLRAAGVTEDRQIHRVLLTQYFHVVALDDGSVGAAMSYSRFSSQRLATLQHELQVRSSQDPLLLELLFEGRRAGTLVWSLQAAVVAALSAPIIRTGGDGSFAVLQRSPPDLLGSGSRALVAGFGGLMQPLASAPHVQELHVVELNYDLRRREIDEQLSRFQDAHPWKAFSASNGVDLVERLRHVDTVSVTGSALCNATLDRFLSVVPSHVHVVVQGQSASIHPAPLFARGVDYVSTTVKGPELVELAARGQSGNAMRTLLEGNLPIVTLAPTRIMS